MSRFRSHRPSRSTAVRAGLLAGAGAAWLLVATQLWYTSVPAGLNLPEVDEAGLLQAAELARIERYERFARLATLASQVVLLAVLVAYAARGARLMRESAAGPIGTGMLLGMLGLAIVWLVKLPFALASHWWDRRHGLSEASYLEWLLEGWLALGAAFLFVCLALLVVMALARVLGQRWWMAGAPVFAGLAIQFAFLFPYLVTGTAALDDPDVAADARRLAQAQSVTGVDVRVEEASKLTSAPNAYAAGLGPSRRVVLWDTLLDGRFGRDEVGVVVAHELGHLKHEHLPKTLGWYALFTLPGAFLIARATRRRGGMADPHAVPLSLLVLVALQLAATPLDNALSRKYEAEADWTALEATRDPAAAERLFQGFSRTALVDPAPPGWAHLVFASHPALPERIAMARAWAALRAERP